ncbi:MAG: DUF4405 domain-containing protein [Negativicutes bacterium]
MIRNILNIVMMVLVLLIMDYRFTGNVFHEIAAVVLALLFIFHNILNWRWYQVFIKGRQSLVRVVWTLFNLLLLVAMITVFITGLLISQTVFAPLGIGSRNLFLHELHQGAAYASLILIAIHLGLQWDMLMARLKNWLRIDSSSLGWIITSRITFIAIIAYGVYASFVNNIGANLFMQHVSMGWGAEPTLWRFLFDYFSIIGCYIGVTYFLMNFLRRFRGKTIWKSHTFRYKV